MAISSKLKTYGAPPRSVRELAGASPTPEHVRYLDLMSRARPVAPDAVIEMNGEPFAYALDATRNPRAEIASLQRSLVFRADAPYLVVIEPGQLSIFPLEPNGVLGHEGRPLRTVKQTESIAPTTLERLFYTPEQALPGKSVHERLFELLSDTVDELSDLGLDRNDAVSLVGRAMFTRFLTDRAIVTVDDFPDVCPQAESPARFFATARNAAATCAWLDRTFNGDFLPLSFSAKREAFSRFDAGVFTKLSDVVSGSKEPQLSFSWSGINFADVPAGLLSQVYEHQAESTNPRARRAKGVYYTPRRVAEFMVKEVFADLRRGHESARNAVVLDPAVGGGVFLVAAFRELVADFWRHHGTQPNTVQIRRILTEQLAGFDVSEPALRLTALSLYLTALELDPDPRPPRKLAFSKLRGSVLFDVRESDAIEGGALLGSLGLGNEHDGRFDVVIGNPPWTSVNRGTAKQIEAVLAPRVRKRTDARFELPDGVPDIGFVWRATDWAKPGGRIAFALHSRLLFKTSSGGSEARAALFGSLDITGILNGSELRGTAIWPQVAAPFCLLFARNRRPSPDGVFYFVSPYHEKALNSQGRFRIDSQSAQPISIRALDDQPSLLKTLFRGTPLDAELLRRVHLIAPMSLSGYWKDKGLATGDGYRITKAAKQDASALHGLPNLGSSVLDEIVVDTARLRPFSLSRLDRVRNVAIYRGPLVLIRESPPTLSRRSDSRPVALSEADVAYSESFYGYSAAGHPHAKLLAQYVFLLLNSSLFEWHALMTSGKFGVERDSIQKLDVDAFPLRPLESLPSKLVERIPVVFQSLRDEDAAMSDEWIQTAYGLSAIDCTTIRETLATRSPYSSVVTEAERAPQVAEVRLFCEQLESALRGTMSPMVGVRSMDSRDGSVWRLIQISSAQSLASVETIEALLRLADKNGASRVIEARPDGTLNIGILAQYRYWTRSQARLLALELLDNRRSEHPSHEQRNA